MDILKKNSKNITPHDVLNLCLDDNEPLTWLTVNVLAYIWNKRSLKKDVKKEDCLATLLDKSCLMQQTKYENIAIFIENVII